MYRQATHPLYLIDIEEMWKNLDDLCQNSVLRKNTIKYSDFITHFEALEHWTIPISESNSMFIRMLELEGVFIKSDDMMSQTFGHRKNTLTVETMISNKLNNLQDDLSNS